MVGAMKIRWMGKLSSSRRNINEISMQMSVNARVPGHVFTLLVAALLLTNGAAAQGQCDAADALLKAQLYDDALTNYTALLKQDPQLDCALKGISESQRLHAINSYELGRAYENAGQVKEARDAYVAALKKYPNYSPAQEALENVSDNKFAAVQTLANLGYYAEAADRLKKVVEENPSIEVPKNLKYLPGGNIPIWEYVRSRIERWGQPVVEIVIFLLGLYVLRWRIWPRIKGICEPRLDIQEFDKGTTGLEIGKGMEAIVEESLMRLVTEDEPTRVHLHLAAGPIEKLAIPADVKSVSPQIKIVSELIEWIFPSNVITLSGYLQKPGDHGAGLTLSIAESPTRDIKGSITIWQRDYDPTATQSAVKDNDPVPYYCLAEPAAIWALFKLNAPSKIKRGIFCRIYWGIKKMFRNFSQLFDSSGGAAVEDREKFAPLGTDDWQSYAYFMAGVRWWLEGNNDKARKLYVDAQNQDMNNYGALFNLGYLDIEDENHDRAIERLSMAKKMSEKSKKSRRDAVWCIAVYQLASAYHYKSILLRACLFSWSKIPGNNNERLLEFLKQNFGIDWIETAKIEKIDDDKTIRVSIEKSSLSLRLNDRKTKVNLEIDDGRTYEFTVRTENGELNIYRAKEDIDKAKKCLDKAEKESRNLVETIQAIIKELQNERTPSMIGKLIKTRKTLEEKEKELKKFLSIEPNANIMHASILVDLAYQGIADQAMIKKEAESKIKNIESKYSKLAPRVRYNLACYYSIVGDKTTDDKQINAYKTALCHLEYALEGGGNIIQWSQKDLSLKGVREFKETKNAFAKLVKKNGDQAAQDSADLPLAGLAIIKEAYAKQLKEQGIVSHCDLILKADTPQAQEALAKKLGISTTLLRRWALLADLMRIVGDTPYVNLLEAADYGSIEALNNVSDPCELANLLNQVNKAQSLVKQLPPLETVQQWVQEAKKPKAEGRYTN